MKLFLKKIFIAFIIGAYIFGASTFSHMVSMNHSDSHHTKKHYTSYVKAAQSNDKACRQICHYIEQNKVLSILIQPEVRKIYYTNFDFLATSIEYVLVSLGDNNLHLSSGIPIVSNPIIPHIKTTILLL